VTSTASVPTAASSHTTTPGHFRIRYGALVVAMMLSFVLVTAEFLPNGLLTDIAAGLDVTPGQAGQMVTVTALVGLFVAPTIGLIFPRLDRRNLLVWLAVAAALSNAIVAIAPSLPLVLAARFLLGAAISGFWAMSIAVAARLAGPDNVGRGVMFTSAGVSIATVAGVPIGVLIGEATDWRVTFAACAIVTGLLAVGLALAVPSIPPAASASIAQLVDTIRRPGVALGLVGHLLVVLGHFFAYSYVRLALERMPDADATTIIVLLGLFGLGGLVGNVVVGLIVDRTYALLCVGVPALLALMLAGMIGLSGSVVAIGVVSFVWGAVFASWLIIVNTWVGHRMPDRLEPGGGLVVVGFQLAIAIAAGVGGLLVDATDVVTVYVVGIVALLVGAVLFGLANRAPRSRGR
jgi:predicted MFS family arabinose efflux permease